MSDDELDKLAAEMKNIRASEVSRERGMAAAMAAFDTEFAAETTTAQEKIDNSQGLANGARPTGQTTYTGYVKTFGRDTMSKLNGLFNLQPKTAMMVGSCAVALFATSLYMPNMTFEDMPKPATKAAVVTADVEARAEAKLSGAITDDVDGIVVTGKKAPAPEVAGQEKRSQVQAMEQEAPPGNPMPSFVPAPAAPPKTVAADKPMASAGVKAQGGITSIDGLLTKIRNDSAGIEAANKTRVRKFQTKPQQAGQLAQTQNRPTLAIGAGSSQAPSITTQQRGGYTFEEVPAEYKTETKTIVTKEATSELVTIPPTYETVTETVVVQEATTELVAVPPQYEWVEGEIKGSSTEYTTVPAQYETYQETIAVQEASTELVTIPPTYNADGTVLTPARTQERVVPVISKTETRRRIKTPASTVERKIPYVIKDGKTRVAVKPARTVERAVPVTTKQVARRVIKTPASTQERVTPAGTKKEVAVRTVVSPQKFYLRDESGQVVREFESRDAFEKYQASLTTVVAETPVSTFSIDVDTASYSFMRSSINRGQLPPRSSIRLEEMINYFPYDYAAPTSADEPFKANVTVTPNPWNADTKLMHVGIKGYTPPADERPSSNLVFLIDTSGSMNAQNKLPLLINSFKLLINTLDEDDTVSIVTYAGRAGTVLEPTSASDKHTIKAALDRLRSGGSTAGAAGLELAYNKAMESFDAEGINRVILATDGDFNVGFSSPDEMKTFVETKRKTGVFLSVLGFGNGNYNDHLMQSLAQNGNGVAAYIDTLAEANKVLANEAGSALVTIAKDVKIQVEFNPETISEYRLIGYETRALKRQDFNNDKVDAGEIGAGHSVTAIYELTPVGSPARSVDPLRYVKESVRPKATGSDEFAFVKIRHKLPNADTSTLQTFPVGRRAEKSLTRAGNDMRFAAAVAAVGQKLRGDTQLEDFSYADAIKLASGAKGKDEHGYRAEFIQLVRLMKSLEE